MKTRQWVEHNGTTGTLTVGNGTPATTANITLLGQYVTGNFHIQSDGAGTRWSPIRRCRQAIRTSLRWRMRSTDESAVRILQRARCLLQRTSLLLALTGGSTMSAPASARGGKAEMLRTAPIRRS
jgi:hypothetical protein